METQPETLANVNGVTMPLRDVRISPLDRGFLFGDAVYEVLRVYGGRPFLADEHLLRLERSLQAIRIEGVDVARLRRRMMETIAAGNFREAIVYIQITRGAAPRSHAFPAGVPPLELLWVESIQDGYVELRQRGAKVISYPDIRWDRCDIKSTNLLGNVLAAQAAKEAGACEAILYLPDGTLTEGSRTSLFGVQGGRVVTSPCSHEILPGVTRSLILGLAKDAGVPIEERHLSKNDLPRVSELFLTGTTSEVLPIVQVDEQLIANGRPGPVAQRLQTAFREAVRALS